MTTSTFIVMTINMVVDVIIILIIDMTIANVRLQFRTQVRGSNSRK